MSEISDMIQRLCPDGVEYRKLGEVGNINRGIRVVKNDLQISGLYPVFQNSLTPLGQYNQYNYDANTAFVISAGAAGDIGFSKTRFWAADDCLVITPFDKIVSKFIFYYLMSQQPYIKSRVRKASIPRLSKDVIYNLEIPVPPLEVQRKIVEVLDNFSELTAELTAELEARKKQYEYYRDNLLNFSQIAPPNSVKWMKLGEICSPIDNIKWKMTSRSYQYIDLSSVDIQTHRIISTLEINCDSAPSRAQQIVRSNDVIFATTRPTQMRACLVPEEYDEQICSTGYCVLRADLSVLLPQFLFYSLTTDSFKEYLSNNLTLGNYPSISNSLLKEYLIPIPPLSEQERIVSILDRFEALTTDLTSGLPAEIKARQQQYEYYRDQLLTLKRAN